MTMWQTTVTHCLESLNHVRYRIIPKSYSFVCVYVSIFQNYEMIDFDSVS